MDKEQIQFEKEQIQRCAISGERYEDAQFPASDASLGQPPKSATAGAHAPGQLSQLEGRHRDQG